MRDLPHDMVPFIDHCVHLAVQAGVLPHQSSLGHIDIVNALILWGEQAVVGWWVSGVVVQVMDIGGRGRGGGPVKNSVGRSLNGESGGRERGEGSVCTRRQRLSCERR